MSKKEDAAIEAILKYFVHQNRPYSATVSCMYIVFASFKNFPYVAIELLSFVKKQGFFHQNEHSCIKICSAPYLLLNSEGKTSLILRKDKDIHSSSVSGFARKKPQSVFFSGVLFLSRFKSTEQFT